ncbi:MAG: DUF4131 domain-containing protein, partial [Nitrospirae bacterium]
MLPQTIAAFIGGLFAGSFFPFLPATVTTFLLLITLGVWWAIRIRALPRTMGWWGVAGMFLGCLYWQIWSWAQPHSLLLDLAGQAQVRISGEVARPVQHAPNRCYVMLAVSSLSK